VCSFAVADLTQPWPAATNGADLMIGDLVLEHIEDLRPVFAQAAKALVPGGCLFISELHPFRQYQGTQANFQRDGKTTPIPAFWA
jgi:2-polyprenyl-3-methyl-5-hydroxy-6-metoxy-1,4-benzoquinol methylase